ncbi:MAG: T9SS type A sorting domain-containing protein [bacterium]
MQRAKVLFITIAVLIALGWALDAASSIGTMNRGVFDPRVKALRAEQEKVKDNPVLVKEIEKRIQEIYLEYDRSGGASNDAERFGYSSYQQPAIDGPDIVIDTGDIYATAADYEMDGTMWVAYSLRRDSSIRVVKSTDHGLTWQGVVNIYINPRSLIRQLGLVVGSGDSTFVYVAYIHPDSSGDMRCVRFKRDGTNFMGFWVKRGADTINSFTFCRDYTAPTFLYMCAGDTDRTLEADDFMLRSTDFAKTWTTTNTYRFVSDGSYQAGAGSYLYLAGFPGVSHYRGQLNLLVNTSFGNPDSWREVDIMPDTFEVDDPVMAPSFVTPPRSAVIWTVYSHNYLNSGDWDIKYVYSTDAGISWSNSYYLAGNIRRDERFADLKPYTSLNNPYVNASYISESSGVIRTVYRHWAEQSNPTGWSDTLRINTNRAGTGRSIKPLLVYSPGAPGTGAGCVFVGAGLRHIYWNSPWTTAIKEEKQRLTLSGDRFEAIPNPATNRTTFFFTGKATGIAIYDAMGRQVWTCSKPEPGVVWKRTDARGQKVSAGVYFVQLRRESGSSNELLVIK